MYFKDNGEIEFNGRLGVGHGRTLSEPQEIKIQGNMILAIDRESRIPICVFKKFSLNQKPFSVDRLNLITLRSFNLLKDVGLPLKLESINVSEDGIALEGAGAGDYTARVFSDPLLVNFHTNRWNLSMSGIESLKEE